MIVFDIETGPLQLDRIKEVLPPFDPDSIGKPPGEFDPDSVKVGNLTDQAKIDAKFKAAREKHAKAVDDFDHKQRNAETDYWQDQLNKAALSAVVGQVVAIGYHGKNRTLHLAVDGVSESALLMKFWKVYSQARADRRVMTGFNIKGFDVPFLAQRSWALGIDVPASILTPTGFLENTFVDLLDRWKCGVRWGGQAGHATLDTVCKALGLPSKYDGIGGDQFARMLWSDNEDNRRQAIAYLNSDIDATVALAERLGVS